MATYVWTINKLFTENITKNSVTYSDVISRVQATLTGTSETDSSISAESSFDLDMDITNVENSFITYNSVSETNVKTWIENRVDASILSNIKTNIEDNIDFEEKIKDAVAKEDSNGDATFPWT